MTCSACGASNPDAAPACSDCGASLLPLPAIGPGFVLASRYEILRVLGRGGMGMVYQAHDRLLEETVAIKVLRPESAASPEVAQRFRAEIKLARTVSHKNVCRIHEYGEDRGIRYISMAYVDGVDLKRVLREHGPLPPREAFDVLARVAEALQAIHDEGIIHRDLKTPNIMVDAKGVVRLMDFGIAKQGESEGIGMTVSGQIIGTPEYMSPEQVQAQKLDYRSDVYSLGIVAFEVFTGATPFRAETPISTALKHLHEAPPLEGPQAALLPPALVPVLRKALAKRREERHSTARELGRALEAALAATPLATERIVATPTASASAAAQETLAPTVDYPAPAVRAPRPAEATTLLPPTVTPARRPLRATRVVWASAALAALAVSGWLALRPGGEASRPVADAGALAAAPALPDASPSGPSPAMPPAAASPSPSALPIAPAPVTPSPAPRPTPAGRASRPDAPTGATDTERAALEAHVERLLAEGAAALESQSFDTAIARYEEALALDPRHPLARMGRATARSAMAARGGAAPAPPAAAAPQPSFVAGRTVAESAETRDDPTFAAAFEDSPDVDVARVTQPALMPGRIEFRTEPASVAAGERYRLEVRFVNAGSGPIQIRDMTVTSTVNDRKASGPVAPAVSTVAPGQSATVLSLSDMLRADLRSWSLEVVLRTTRGEGYRNRLVWNGPGAAEPR